MRQHHSQRALPVSSQGVGFVGTQQLVIIYDISGVQDAPQCVENRALAANYCRIRLR
jgi:hypothetical protein